MANILFKDPSTSAGTRVTLKPAPGFVIKSVTTTSSLYTYARTIDLEVPEGRYYLGDAGFGTGMSVLVPYRGVRYHLKEWERSGLRFVISNLCVSYQTYQYPSAPRHPRSCSTSATRRCGMLLSVALVYSSDAGQFSHMHPSLP